MGAMLAYLILKDSLTGSDEVAEILGRIVDGLRNPSTQFDFALCAP